jgi:hypothetical protein
MQLSPFTNYTIRRMLQDHVDSLSEIQARSLRVSESVSLDRLLSTLYPRKFIAISKVHHLEMLTELYRRAVTAGRITTGRITTSRNDLSNQTELRRRIFQILGVRFGVNEVMMPPIVPEIEGDCFKFFGGGELRDGMSLGGKVYGRIESAVMRDRPYLYQIAIAFSEQKIPCIITTSQEKYSLWVLLRSPVYSVYLKQGLTPVKKALVLHSALCRFKQARFSGR